MERGHHTTRMRRARATLSRRPRTLAALALAGIALGAPALTGCGDEPPLTRVSGERVVVRLDEYRVLPEHIEVRAGRITFVATNVGELTHNVGVVQFERALGDDEDREYGKHTKTLFPSQTGETTVDLAPGKYRLICSVANHDNLGQYAELDVVR